jgi:hypothetical protein
MASVMPQLTLSNSAPRRSTTALALWAAVLVACPASARAQMGQSAMAPAGGLVNRAMGSLGGFGQDGPGWFYYGINAADRGLGYRGSYMTLGGFFPTVQDDLGGLWSADLRGHLSEYGGFFSNVGAVRKQFIGGTLLGVGVYWDYDGDQNQYADTPIDTGNGNTYSFAGGYSYNQVGISGEWLTDFGNLRSNGYIPLGSTGALVGPFLQNTVLCQNGINAALGGADLEVGAYVPGLTDWAGMVSVGGYALGNTLYTFPNGDGAVPWFGGVYTRLDMTFRNNWDFSLQANNDSYFDWTGFARLTYRMGASRRRNVPDQMEQPMMRNEHIVRARQTPEVALNPVNGDPWRVFTVDNSATSSAANGTAEDPFTTLAQASAAATNPFDIVFVRVGDSTASPYVTQFDGYQFAASNQYLIGEGSSLALPTANCGPQTFFAGSSTAAYPRISNPLGPAIVIDKDGTTVSHLQITDSLVGISDRPAGLPAPGQAFVSDVEIIGGAGPSQRGIEIANSTGTFNFDAVRLRDLSNDGLVVSAANGRVEVTNSTFANITGDAVRVSGASAVVNLRTTSITDTDGRAMVAAGMSSQITLTSGTVQGTAGDAAVASGAGSSVAITDARIVDTNGSALTTTGSGAQITTTNTVILNSGSTGSAVLLSGPGSRVTIANTRIDNVGGVGARLNAPESVFNMTAGSRIQNTGADGILVDNPDAFAIVSGKSVISRTGGNGITSNGGRVQVVDSTIERVVGAGILATGVSGVTPTGAERAVWVQGATIQNAEDGGIVVENSDLRVEQVDPARLSSKRTRIANTGLYGIRAVATGTTGPFDVLVDQTAISGVDIGISIAANPLAGFEPTINFTATDNSIATNGGGTGINLSAAWNDQPAAVDGTVLSRVNAVMTGNQITTGGGTGILLTSIGGPLQYAIPGGGVAPVDNAKRPISIRASSGNDLSSLNNGTNVVSVPAGVTPDININYNPGLTLPANQPPSPPQLP